PPYPRHPLAVYAEHEPVPTVLREIRYRSRAVGGLLRRRERALGSLSALAHRAGRLAVVGEICDAGVSGPHADLLANEGQRGAVGIDLIGARVLCAVHDREEPGRSA